MSQRERDKDRKKFHDGGFYYEGHFDENSPRPPVPGEERTHCMSDWGLPHEFNKHKTSSPIPRKSYYQNDACSAPMGFEPEGSSRPGRSKESSTPPACLRWARALHYLLEDSDGVVLFKNYLQSEGQTHADTLDFWFACEGLRKQNEPDTVKQLVKVIYKRFFVKSCIPLPEDLRRDVERRVRQRPATAQPTSNDATATSPVISVQLFDEAQMYIERLINNTTYPNFLKSDMYLHHVQSVQNATNNSSSSGGDLSSGSSSSSSSVSATTNNRELAALQGGNVVAGPLPTLHEDAEFSMQAPLSIHHHTPGTGCHTPDQQLRLTKDTLLVTQKRRLDVRPKPEAYAGVYMYRGPSHAAYSSYNPVSRQDSELQSLSSHSDIRTSSDNLTDSSIDGSVYRMSRRQQMRQQRKAHESASMNREPQHVHQTLIPRTQRLDTRQCQPMQPDEFAAILIEKLEAVKREMDAKEMLDLKLKQGDLLADAIEQIQFANADQDNDQDILDQHLSRVWKDNTPSRSPGVNSPRPPHFRMLASRRKDKDGVSSTFSSDSGNVHDFADLCAGDVHKLVKSKSMPMEKERFVRQSTSRRSSSKKTLAELTDSGVSVVSDTPPSVKDNRVMTWLMESSDHKATMGMGGGGGSSNSTLGGGGYSHSEMSHLTGGVKQLLRSAGPAQPFIADPNMPPLPSPHTTTQLEEAVRRLHEAQGRAPQGRKEVVSGPSTLRKTSTGSGGGGGRRPPQPSQNIVEDFTVVVYSFCDEQFPYRTRIPGKHVTLKQFKDFLPRKGNYRYFFKTECEELDNQVIQEEVICDSDELPLWEGRIMAQVKPVD